MCSCPVFVSTAVAFTAIVACGALADQRCTTIDRIDRLSQCQHQFKEVNGMSKQRVIMLAHRPCCDVYGNYRPLQIDASTGYSWCVDRLGVTVSGSLSGPGEGMPRCEPIDPTGCQLQVQHILRQLLTSDAALVNYTDPAPENYCYYDDVTADDAAGQTGVTVDFPECDTRTGQYRPMQTDDLSGDRWCVGPEGLELTGTRTSSQLPDPDCQEFTPKETKLTKCEREYKEATKDQQLIGLFVPRCDANGNYEPLQCWASTGTCWCVDVNGSMINGTLTWSGKLRPVCDRLAD